MDDNKVLKEDLEVYKGFFDNFFGALQKASQNLIDMIEPYIPVNFKDWFYRVFGGYERDWFLGDFSKGELEISWEDDWIKNW